MSNDNRSKTDWENVAFIICGFLAIILTIGSPDLLDAIIARVMP